MDRVEFIRQLRIALSGSVNHIIIEDNIRYYEDYIDMEIRKGKSEEQVLQELGSPRLIAKTIIETNKTAGTSQGDYDSSNATYDESESAYQGWFGRGMNENKAFKIPLWVFGVVIFLVIMLFFVILTTAMAALLPYLLPIILIIAAARLIRTLWR